MASATLAPVVGWLVGETISVYERDTRNVAVGSAVTTAAVGADSTTTFSGLTAETKYIATDGTHEVRFGTHTDPLDSAQSGSARKVTVADLGATYTLDVNSDTDVWLIAGVTSAVALTLTNLPTGAGRIKLLLTPTGGPWTVTLHDGASTQDVTVSDDAEINLSWDGSTVWVNVEGPGEAGADGADGIDGADGQTTVTANTQTANYTLVLGDAGKSVEMNNASARTITVPPNASVAFPTGTVIELCRLGAGSLTIVQGAAVTLPNRIEAAGTTNRTIVDQYSSASIRKRATNEWVLEGNIA